MPQECIVNLSLVSSFVVFPCNRNSQYSSNGSYSFNLSLLSTFSGLNLKDLGEAKYISMHPATWLREAYISNVVFKTDLHSYDVLFNTTVGKTAY